MVAVTGAETYADLPGATRGPQLETGGSFTFTSSTSGEASFLQWSWRYSNSVGSGYAVRWDAAANTVELFRIDTGWSYTSLSSTAFTLTAGDTVYWITRHDSDGGIKVWTWKTGSLPASPTLTGTDNTYPTGGESFSAVSTGTGTDVYTVNAGLYLDDLAPDRFSYGPPPGRFGPWSQYPRFFVNGLDAATQAISAPVTVSGLLVTNVVSVTVQAAFGSGASSAVTEGDWVDLAYVHSVDVNQPASRNLGALVRYQAGTCRVVLGDPDRRYDPSNVDGVYSDTDGTQVLPMTPVRVIAHALVSPDGSFYDVGGEGGSIVVDYPLFRGYADTWDVGYSSQAKTSQTVLTAVDGTAVLSAFDGPEQAGAGAGETSGPRVTRILNNADWPAELRNIETGTATLQATTLAQPAWTELLLTADSERGDIFIDGQGRLTFFGQTHRATDTRSSSPQADWDDDPDSLTSTLRFANPQISFDRTLIYNQINISNVGGTMQTSEDATSQARYLTRSLKRTDFILQTDGAALSYANLLLAELKDPYVRVDGITYDPGSAVDQTVAAPTVFGVQRLDRWKVRFTPPGGGDRLIRDVWVVGMSWHFEQGRFHAGFTFQPITPRVDMGFTLDSSTLGVLDSATEMAY